VRVLDFGIARWAKQSASAPLAAAPESTGAADASPARPDADAEALAETQPSAPRGGAPRRGEARSLTRPGSVIGTPAFMSPEQHNGKVADFRSDQFSFCVALWQALYGQPPFPGETDVQIAFATGMGRLVPPPEGHGRPAALEPILRRGLAVEPEARFPSMDGLLTALSGVRQGSSSSEGVVLGHRYSLLEPLDEAEGFRAMDRLAGGVVEVHRLSLPEGVTPRAALDRLGMRAGLRHPNLQRILDFGLDALKRPFVVCESLERAADIVEAGRDAHPDLQASLLAQVLRALVYLHRRGFAHARVDRAHAVVIDGRVKLTGLALGALEDEAPEPRADLASVGEIARAIWGEEPSAPEGGALGSWAQRLGNERSGAGFETAMEALEALGPLLGESIPIETLETRESLLRTAPLVGRDAELELLEGRLREALGGRGGAVLLGGESGAGKSRLVEELARRGTAEGAVVVVGQADAEQRHSYGVWRRVLSWLALLGQPDNLTAGVLAAHVPEMKRIIGETVETLPELDAESTQARLSKATLKCLSSIDAPLVILLEDLHWMRSESSRLLADLLPALPGRPVLLVGTYRDDARPRLPSEVVGMQEVRVGRLDAGAVGDLCRSVAGELPSAWIDAIVRETEGNPFFAVEVLRAIAHQERPPAEDGEAPIRLSPGAVRRFTGHRLARLEPEARALLELAALVGREVDYELLEVIEPGHDLDRWLEACGSVAILEPTIEGWRFAHDKIREHLIETLDPAKKARLHARVAEGLERTGRSDPSAIRALAQHHRAAGNVEAEAVHVGPAGASALAVGAHAEAVELLERALELGHGSPADRASWLRMLGEARYVRGDHAGAVRALRESVGSVVSALPSRRARLGLRAGLETARQLRHLLFRARPSVEASRRAALREASSAAGRLANLATYRGDALEVISATLVSANLADKAGWTNVYGLAVMGYSAAYLGAVSVAERYFRRSREAAERRKDPMGLVEVIQMECVLLAGTGAFPQADALLETCESAARRAGYGLGEALTLGFRASLEGLKGRVRFALELVDRALEGLGPRDEAHRHATTAIRVEILLAAGDLSGARALLETLERMPCDYALGEAFVLGVKARVHAALGDVEAAWGAATALDGKLSAGLAVPPISVHQVLDGMSEALVLGLSSGPWSAASRRLARRHRRRLARMAKSFVAFAPEARRFEGRLALLRGQRRKAERAFSAALVSAERGDRRLERALAHVGLADVADTEDAAQLELERARALFEDGGAGLHAAAVEARLLSRSKRPT
jgi:tetratricopeptide (TPR) repeat protein